MVKQPLNWPSFPVQSPTATAPGFPFSPVIVFQNLSIARSPPPTTYPAHPVHVGYVAQTLPCSKGNVCLRTTRLRRRVRVVLRVAFAVRLLAEMLLLSCCDALHIRACTVRVRTSGLPVRVNPKSIPSLLIVSTHSSYGSESNTIPPWCGWLATASKARSTLSALPRPEDKRSHL